MTEQEAHDRLHEVLPPGSTVTISHNSWSRSTVGSGPVVHSTHGDWHVVVTVPDGVDHTDGEFAPSLDVAVERLLARLPAILAEAQALAEPPPRLTAPSARPPSERQEHRDAS